MVKIYYLIKNLRISLADQLITQLNTLAQEFHLSPRQIEQFAQYATLLKKASKEFNITTITDDAAMVNYHFKDSLMVTNYLDFSTINYCADVGTGGGFPGLPLKIRYPDLPMILIEVTEKKIRFLEMVIQELGLTNIEVCNLDWRTFLRKTSYPIDLFLARASLQPIDLIKIFKPSSLYKNATIVYWAAEHWQPGAVENFYISQERGYSVGDKERKLVFFKNH